jgi:hypothetical protein
MQPHHTPKGPINQTPGRAVHVINNDSKISWTAQIIPVLSCQPTFLTLKKKAGFCDRHALCVSVYPPYQLLNGWINLYETWYVYHDTWAHSKAYIINPSQSVYLYVYPVSLLGNGSVNQSPRQQTNTRRNRGIVERVVLYAVHVLRKESRPFIFRRIYCF